MPRPLAVVALLGWLAARSLSAATSVAAPVGLTVEGTAFVVRLANGGVLRSPELVGAELDLGAGSTLRLDGVRRDPEDPTGETLLHTFSLRQGDGPWENPCAADGAGRQEGFPVPGRWDEQGRFRTAPDHFALTCTSGAQAKCVRFGYRPWLRAADGTPLAPLYEACVHMVRADYCGDGTATTRDGTLIDIFDDAGVQRPESGPELRFEAGWAPTGAVCVAHPRIPENVSLAALGRSCPRLAAALGVTCTEAAARRLGAVLFNRSR